MSNPDIAWNAEKNEWLKKVRGVGFDDLVLKGRFILSCHNKTRTGQQLMLIEYLDYIWVVPFVKEGEKFFFKTLYQNRKLTRLFRRGELL